MTAHMRPGSWRRNLLHRVTQGHAVRALERYGDRVLAGARLLSNKSQVGHDGFYYQSGGVGRHAPGLDLRSDLIKVVGYNHDQILSSLFPSTPNPIIHA